jgi:hypothetical protein
LAVTLVITSAWASVMMFRNHPDSTFIAHARVAEVWFETGRGYPPQFLGPLFTIVVHVLLPPHSFLAEAELVAVISVVAATAITYWMVLAAVPSQLRPQAWIIASVLSLALQIVDPITFFTLSSHNLYFGYVTPNFYDSQTELVNKPFVLLLYLFGLRVFQAGSIRLRYVFVAAVVSLLAAAAKPTFTIVLLPAMAILGSVYLIRRSPLDYRLAIAGIAVPSVAILLWQQRIAASVGIATTGLRWAPLLTFQQSLASFGEASVGSAPWLAAKFLLSAAFPLVVLISFGKRAFADPGLQLSWIAFGIACFLSYMLYLDSAGNLVWTAHITLYVLFIASATFVVRQLTGRVTGPVLACGAVFALHVAAGAIWYVAELGPRLVTWM